MTAWRMPINAVTFGSGAVADDPVTPDPGPVDPPDGTNLAVNSKFVGDDGVSATNWTESHPTEGEITFTAGAVAEHRDARFVSTATTYTDRAFLRQSHEIVEGQVYILSAYVVAVTDAGPEGNDHVILNHDPWSALAVDPAAPRPLLADLTPGDRVWYRATATETRTVDIIVGLDREGDVTLNRVMFEEAATLGGYVATDPVAPPVDPDPPVGSEWYQYAWDGYWEGCLHNAKENNVMALNNTGIFGYSFEVPEAGDLDLIQIQLASNFDDQGSSQETSKSRVDGVATHSYPAEWDFKAELWRLNADWSVNGALAWSWTGKYVNPDGVSIGTGNNSRVLTTWNPGVTFAAGEKALFRIRNLEASPSATYFSLNSIASNIAPSLNTGRRNNIYHGNDPLPVRGGNRTPVNGMLSGCVYKLSTGLIVGQCHFDATNSGLGRAIGGTWRARQTWSQSYWRRSNGLFRLAARWDTGTQPAAGLTVQLSGADISTRTLTIPAGSLPSSSGPLEGLEFQFPGGDITLSPGTVYTVEIYSPGSTTSVGYRLQTVRVYGTSGIANSGNVIPLPSCPQVALNLHDWSGTAEYSTNGGSSWSPFGYPSLGGNISFALWINRNIASTEGGLT